MAHASPCELSGHISTARNLDIRVDEITHFVMGMFWKAGVHSWSGSQTEPVIDLGPYTEPIGGFLRGEQEFPDHVALTKNRTKSSAVKSSQITDQEAELDNCCKQAFRSSTWL